MKCPYLPNAGRRGFTLIELLMVITIIALLVGIFSPVAYKMITTTRERAVILEINQLDMAMQEYRNQRGEYPPNMGMVLTDTGALDTVERERRFTRHVRRAFPRATLTYVNVRNNMRTSHNAQAINYEYTYKAKNGSIQHIDLDTLDQAEALVFWLAGFPTPWETKDQSAVAPRKLFGFHNDPANPWKRDPRSEEAPRPLDFRMPLLFAFDEGRLVDNDDDGWLEYVPQITTVTTDAEIAPFVYFDSATYVTVSPSGNVSHDAYPPQNSPMRSIWGLAVPYALFFDPNRQSPARWVNPEGIQIICAGFDGMYGSPGDTNMRVPVFPSGATYRADSGYSSQSYYDKEEQDNLTNFAASKLLDARDTSNPQQ